MNPSFDRRALQLTTWQGEEVRPNHAWAYYFVFDACANGQKVQCLTVVDE